MSISSLASAAIASQQGQLAQAMQTAMLKASAAQEATMVELLAEAVNASVPPGTGTQLDIKV